MKWTHGLVTFSAYNEDGFLGIQCDVYGEQNSGMPPFEAIGPYGFFSRPTDPDNEGGSSVLYFRQGDQIFALSLGDSRRTAALPPMPKGSSVQYCDKPSFWVLNGEDGTQTGYVEYPDGTTAHLVTIGFDANGKPVITIKHGDGQGLTFYEGTSVLQNASGSVYLELGSDGGIHNGNLKVNGSLECNGARLTPTGDVITKTGISLTTHFHPTAMGPSGPPVPTAPPG
jgi:hypothetical protein